MRSSLELGMRRGWQVASNVMTDTHNSLVIRSTKDCRAARVGLDAAFFESLSNRPIRSPPGQAACHWGHAIFRLKDD